MDGLGGDAVTVLERSGESTVRTSTVSGFGRCTVLFCSTGANGPSKRSMYYFVLIRTEMY